MNDIINNPAHYAAEVGKEIDCLTAMHACVGDGEFAGHLRCQMFKYIWRFKRKLGADPIDDLRKLSSTISVSKLNNHYARQKV